MGRRLYVGNLPYDVDEASLREVFEQDGRQVERVHIPLDRETQRPRGFAFVEFATENEAQQALAELDGELLGARAMRISEAQERAAPERLAPAADSGGSPHRAPRFGPDSRPKRDRDKEFKRGKPHRHRHAEDDDHHHGRRGHRRFDEDDDY